MSKKDDLEPSLYFSDSFVMDDTGQKGQIYNEDAFKQPMLFEGMTYERGISPSDWDFFLEFSGVLFFYGEGKKKPKDLTKGQKYSIEHVCNSHTKAGNKAIGFMYEHSVQSPFPVYVKDQTVVKYYWMGHWKLTNRRVIVAEFIDEFIKLFKKKGLI